MFVIFVMTRIAARCLPDMTVKKDCKVTRVHADYIIILSENTMLNCVTRNFRGGGAIHKLKFIGKMIRKACVFLL